jgi:5-methylcytosine-specific restriction protein B
MTKVDLGLKLKEMYDNALKGEKVAMIHLFGIKYSAEIQESGASFQDIAVAAGFDKPYGTEISKGAKLSKYVMLK